MCGFVDGVEACGLCFGYFLCSREQRELVDYGEDCRYSCLGDEGVWFLLSQPQTLSTSPSATPGVSVDIVPSFC